MIWESEIDTCHEQVGLERHEAYAMNTRWCVAYVSAFEVDLFMDY
jgi:hypothetical protein